MSTVETKTRSLYYRDTAAGRLRWEVFFSGRTGCSFRTVTSADFDRDDNEAPGLYIDLDPPLADAWDMVRKTTKGMRGPEYADRINAALDAVSPRA